MPLKPDKTYRPRTQEEQDRVQFALKHGWTEVDDADMTGVGPVGPRVRRPLPYVVTVDPSFPAQGFTHSNPHWHCPNCWGTESIDVGGSKRCVVCPVPRPVMLVCIPEICGSS